MSKTCGVETWEASWPRFGLKFIEYEGQFENQERATRRLLLIVPIMVTLIFGLLVVVNIPFALVGGIAALWIRE